MSKTEPEKWISISVGLLSALLLSCGRLSNDDPNVDPPPRIVSMTSASHNPSSDNRVSSPEERAQYCMAKLEPETEAVASEILSRLNGTWEFRGDSDRDGYSRRTFRFGLSQKSASLTTNYTLWPESEDIQFRKVCLSKPLDSSHGYALEGYRVLEMMAENNEGGVAFLVKMDFNASSPYRSRLALTGYHYARWASNTLLKSEELIHEQEFTKIWTYPRKPY